MTIKNGIRPIHPGEILRENFLGPLDLTPNALSKALHVPPALINEILREDCSVSPDTALRLARYFGTTSEFWMNLQIDYDLKIA